MLIDTHLHLADENNIDDIINEAKDKNVNILVLGSTNVSDIKKNIEIANNYENIYVEVGFHPSEVGNITLEDYSFLEDLVKSKNNKIVAIGEIGLDYYYGKDDKNKQIALFKRQLDIASKYNLPVVIHSRDAVLDTINILKEYNLRGIIHCFSGSYETAMEYIKMGYFLGIGGVLTFKNSNLKDVIKKIDLKNIVLETDSPYLSPIRGSKNSPANVLLVAQFLSDLKGVSLDEVSNITTENAIGLFDLK